MFKLFTKRALMALTLVVFASVGFGLSAKKPKRFYSKHWVGANVVYKQTNLKHCHSGCKRAPNVVKNCTSRCRACLSKNEEGLEFAWSMSPSSDVYLDQKKTSCGVGVLDDWIN